ncbi:MAG: serine/threonine protein kinase [Kiritimatiellae bacterium]|nr:serine/threonine protein kinase [Kiritimatiellia bacterium]
MLPESLKALADELDAMGGMAPVAEESKPSFEGTDFRLERLLGRGGMGSVYLAEQLSLSRRVAVKILGGDMERERFLDEAKTIARLHHPNIVHVYAAGLCGARPYFAMELMEGESAATKEFSGLDDVVRLGVAVADALAYAHACGIVHRDVKPSNIFLDGKGAAKLGDFGLACACAGAGESAGTARYMPPETLSGEAATALSDQYSLGASLIELAAGFPGWRSRRNLLAVLEKATSPEPAGRYPDVASLAADLRRCLAGEPVEARPVGMPVRFAMWVRKNRLAAAGLAAAALLFAGLAVSLAVGYARTSRALARADAALAQADDALRQVEGEATSAAQSLVSALAVLDRGDPDRRETQLRTALADLKRLAGRYPENAEIRAALGRLRYAIEAHRRMKERRGAAQRPF